MGHLRHPGRDRDDQELRGEARQPDDIPHPRRGQPQPGGPHNPRPPPAKVRVHGDPAPDIPILRVLTHAQTPGQPSLTQESLLPAPQTTQRGTDHRRPGDQISCPQLRDADGPLSPGRHHSAEEVLGKFLGEVIHGEIFREVHRENGEIPSAEDLGLLFLFTRRGQGAVCGRAPDCGQRAARVRGRAIAARDRSDGRFLAVGQSGRRFCAFFYTIQEFGERGSRQQCAK